VRIPVVTALTAVLTGGLLCASAGAPVRQAGPLPTRESLMALVRAAARLDIDLQKDFVYIERRRDVKVGPLGKVSVGPLRTFEVFPSAEPGRTYKRLIAIEDRPLDPAELQRRDADHARDLAEETRRSRRDGSDAQTRRRAEHARRQSLAILADALDLFELSPVSRELVDGEPTIEATMTPRPNARVSTREGGWMKQFEGRGWFVEADGQLARLDMHAVNDVSIGWGIIGRLHKGTRLVVERHRVGHTWLPGRLTFEATGRTLMFRPFELHLVTEYSDYKAK